LLGIRLLTLDASVVVAPAEITAAPHRSSHGVAEMVTGLPAQLPTGTAGRAPVVGRDLADAARFIDEAAASLAAARARPSEPPEEPTSSPV
jgi:hypothetical protein